VPLANIVLGPAFGPVTVWLPSLASGAPHPNPLPFAMSFGQFLTAPQVWPFSLALLIFFSLALLEVLLVFTGLGGNYGLEVDVDIPDINSAWRFLDWLGIGKVPVLVSACILLFSFGLLGLIVQSLQLGALGLAIPWPIVAVGCFLVALPIVRGLNHLLGRIWPQDESSAVSADSFIGHEAVVVMGKVSMDTPGQIKVRNPGGHFHYALAHADVAEEAYEAGEPLLIVGRRGATYTVIRHPNPSNPSTPSTPSRS
jgi:hypothetical protein